MHWAFLIIAGLLEAFWPMALKASHGFTKLYPSLFAAGIMGVSIYLLGLAMKQLEPSLSYIIFIGMGAVGILVLDALILKKGISLTEIAMASLIIIGVLGLYFLKS